MPRSSYDSRILNAARRGSVAEEVAGRNGKRFWMMGMSNVDTPVERLLASGDMAIVIHRSMRFACAAEHAEALRQELRSLPPIRTP